ncbi:MAG: hypothetical protein ACO1SV_04470 [Fimbriimonas sp.]
MTLQRLSGAFALLLAAGFIAGCGDDEAGSAPVVKVSADQRAKDLNATAEATVKWLESLPPAERQAAIGRSPQVAASLKEASDPALQERIKALGVQLP